MVTDMNLQDLVDSFSRSHAQAAWEAGLAAIAQIDAIVRDKNIACEFAWNTAERTWDCPCHGSRFNRDGSVIAGPAEAPLSEPE